MQTQTIERTERRRIARNDVEDAVRGALGEADVTRLSVADTGGHTLVEVPVRPDELTLLMDVAPSAVGAVAERVGDVVLTVEREPQLAQAPGGEQPVRASMGAGSQAAAGGRQRPASGGQGSAGGQASAEVTQADIDRIAEANSVPEGSEAAVERIEPEPLGDPELKDTSTPFSPSEPGRKTRKPSR